MAIGGLATAFIALDDLPTSDTRATLNVQMRKHMNLTGDDAQEIEVLGQWLVSECGTPVQAVPRLAKKLRTLDKDGANFQVLLAILQDVAQNTETDMSARQSDALHEIKQAYRLK